MLDEYCVWWWLCTSQVSCLSRLPITMKLQWPMKILHFWLCFHQPLCNHVLGYMYLIVQSLIILQFLLHLWPGYSVRYSYNSLSIFRRASLPVYFIDFASCTSILQSKCIPLRLFCEKENILSPRNNVMTTSSLFVTQDWYIPKDNMVKYNRNVKSGLEGQQLRN